MEQDENNYYAGFITCERKLDKMFFVLRFDEVWKFVIEGISENFLKLSGIGS